MEDDYDTDTYRNEVDKIWEAFMTYDVEGYGNMPIKDLKEALDHAGEKCSDDQVYMMIS